MEKSIRIAQILGDKQEYYLGHSCKTIDKSLLYTPGPDVIEKVWMNSDRNLCAAATATGRMPIS